MKDTTKHFPVELNYCAPISSNFPPVTRDTYYQIALVCWAFPHVAGIVNFLLWAALRWHTLINTGLVILGTGLFAAMIGPAYCGLFFAHRWRLDGRGWKERYGPVVVLILLYALSILIALVLFGFAGMILFI